MESSIFYFFALSSYGLMYPLTKIKLDDYEPNSFIHPLWETEAKMAMKVYLSTKATYNENFLKSEFTFQGEENRPEEIVLLWEESINTAASLSKTFLISSLDCIGNDSCSAAAADDDDDNKHADPSLTFAKEWLDAQDKARLEDDGSILSTIQSAAGQGIESTSILLTVGQGIAKKLNSLMVTLGLVDDATTTQQESEKSGVLARSNVHLPASSPIWSNLMNNSTIYVHVVLVREKFYLTKEEETTYQEARMALGQAYESHSLLLGKVDLVKYDTPTHLGKPNRILLWDLEFLFRKYVLRSAGQERPPWDMEVTKPEYFAAYQQIQEMKAQGRGYPYWKPEVAVKYLIDEESYPMDIAQSSGMVSVLLFLCLLIVYCFCV